MRAALLSSRPRQGAGTARIASLPAPVQGWNTRDPLAQMKPLYAAVLENWFPADGEVQVRGGAETWATGGSGTVRTLISFAQNTGTKKLLACTDAGVYNATAGGAMGAAIAALTNGKLETVILTNSAGTNYLWGCNGTDKVQTYDGTTWAALDGASTPAILGPTVTDLNWCWMFKRRVFAVQKNSMNAWYGPIDSIAGTFSKFPLGAIFRRGGYLLSGANWTVDAGAGADDYCVFITSEGEVAVYQGINPASATSWSLVGVYFVGKPPSRRCFVNYGPDLAITTEFGELSLSQLLQSGLLSVDKALSSAIRPTFSQAVRDYAANTGWQALVYPARNALIVNVPIGVGVTQQLVMNTITGAWCSFLGWNTEHFVVHDGVLYFGLAGGSVAKAWDGTIAGDFGVDTVAVGVQAWNRFGASSWKQMVMARPLITIDNSTELGFGFSADFDRVSVTSTIPRGTVSVYPSWGSTLWGTALWAGELIRQKRWYHVSSEPGFAQAYLLQAATKDATIVSWSGTDFQVV